MDSEKNIVILGGSYGGLSTAHYLLKHVLPKLPDNDSYKVILVSTSSQVFCRPACPRAMISDEAFSQEKLFVDIKPQFDQYGQKGLRFIHGTVTELDHKHRKVTITTHHGTSEVINFHAAVIATGSSSTSPLLGLQGDEKMLRERWASLRTSLSTATSIVIAGGGPAGVEAAGELGEHLNGRAGFLAARLPRPNVKITVVTSAQELLPALRPSLAGKAESLLAKVGVTVIKNTRVISVTPEGTGTDPALLTTPGTVLLADGRSLEADIYIPAMGTTPNTSFLTDRSLLSRDGRIETNSATLRVDGTGPDGRVYAIGDASTFARPAVHTILAAVPVLCSNMQRDLLRAAGQAVGGQDRVYREDKRETQLVPIGRTKGVGAAMGWQVPSFLVWLIKGRDYWLWTTGDLWSGKQWSKES
ncbi:FAD/NAD(P)-binding domain-containing protein [Cryphonectria parasitica EP155]|uniref:FAD/NAD(P)-binding domain-containing protein n=1 Tax=Cryphonectria parasitica (strain ATCC 38755 / EP155) TaxID=660469 RepID=A0A9P4Y6Q5_CRYP1|nr:FAD/NAD(P)-binding domain-containing protein [Cryphonectria parasitica EP155]KAF3767115.1 FAD/NAD(P)-binding domain-containing protein [Cryphonectria parasitica EP155]